MFGLFFRPKEGIRIFKTYDGIDMKPTILGADSAETRNRVKDIKEHPKQYAWHIQKDDNLSGIPDIEIKDVHPPELVPEHNVNIICDVHIKHTTHVPQVIWIPPFPKFLITLAFFSIIGLIGLVLWFSNAAKIAQIDAACYYYTKNGTPSSIILEGREYKLKPDGTLDDIDRVFMNPYHEAILKSISDNQCNFINTKE